MKCLTWPQEARRRAWATVPARRETLLIYSTRRPIEALRYRCQGRPKMTLEVFYGEFSWIELGVCADRRAGLIETSRYIRCRAPSLGVVSLILSL